MKYLLVFILASNLYAQDAQFFRAVKVETNSIQRTGVAAVLETNSIARYISTSHTNEWPNMIQGELTYQIVTNWIDESITKKLPEDPHDYTLHQLGQISTNIICTFKFEGRTFSINLGIKQATNTFKRDRIFKKRMQQDTPPIPTLTTNVPTELPYSIRTRIP